MAEPGGDGAGGGGHLGQVDAGLDAHAVEHVEQVLGGQVPARSGRVGTAPEAARRAVDGGDARLQGGEHVGEGRAPRVVEVDGEGAGGHDLFQPAHDVGHLGRNADADGVADGDLVAPGLEQPPRHLCHLFRLHLSLVRAAEAGGYVAAHPEPVLRRLGHELRESLEALVDRRVDVLLVEGLAGGGEDGDLLNAGLPRLLEALAVGDEHRCLRARPPADAAYHLVGARHLRHPARRDEGPDLNDLQAGVEQALAKRHAIVHRDRGRLVLKAVARPDLHHRHPARQRVEAHSSSTSTMPALTMSPGRAATDFTVPSRGARRAFSIFIASTTSSSCPFVTAWPGSTRTAITRPGIGASSAPGTTRWAERELSPSASSRYAVPRQKRWTTSPSRTQWNVSTWSSSRQTKVPGATSSTLTRAATGPASPMDRMRPLRVSWPRGGSGGERHGRPPRLRVAGPRAAPE